MKYGRKPRNKKGSPDSESSSRASASGADLVTPNTPIQTEGESGVIRLQDEAGDEALQSLNDLDFSYLEPAKNQSIYFPSSDQQSLQANKSKNHYWDTSLLPYPK
jgi:hypothetical protein